MSNLFILFLFFMCVEFISSFHSSHQIVKIRTLTRLHNNDQRILTVPYFPDKSKKDHMWLDIYNALGRDRVLFISRFVDSEACQTIVSSIVYLNSISSTEPITLYLNIPGASSSSALTIYSILKSSTCPIKTVNVGLTVGLGCLLSAAGTKGMRFATPNARFLLSKGGIDDEVSGHSLDILSQLLQVNKENDAALKAFSEECGKDYQQIKEDFQRDFYLTSSEACLYGLIDEIMIPSEPIKMMKNRGIDNNVINFGHFSELRTVKADPNDPNLPVPDPDEEDKKKFQKMMQSKNKKQNDRFANSRCKPPSSYKEDDGTGNDNNDVDKSLSNSGF